MPSIERNRSDATTREFEDLLNQVLPSARRFAANFSSGPLDADDLIQEASFKAYKYFERFEPGTSFRAWFLRILRNHAYERHRYWKRRGQWCELEPERPVGAQLRVLRVEAPDPAEAVDSEVSMDRITSAITDLPSPYREACELRLLSDLSYEEVAESLECPIGTVRSRIHRGTRILQRSLSDVWQEYQLAG